MSRHQRNNSNSNLLFIMFQYVIISIIKRLQNHYCLSISFSLSVPPHTQPVDNIRKNMTLKEIISRYPFPINVCFSDPEEYIDCLNCNHPQRIAQSTLQVVAVHEQAYFLVSTVLPDSGTIGTLGYIAICQLQCENFKLR